VLFIVAGIVLCSMANDDTFNHVDYILGNIGGLVGDTLQVAGDEEEMDENLYLLGVFFYIILNEEEYFFIHLIHFVVGSADLPCPL
jgi:hypothetical protein